MFWYAKLASNSSLQAQDVKLRIGNGATVIALAIGSKSLYLSEHVLYLDHVLYVPDAFKNIISISSLTTNEYEFQFMNDVFNVHFRNKIIGLGYLYDALYYLDNNNQYKTSASNQIEFNAIIKSNSYLKHLWQLRFGHVAEDRIAKLDKMIILSSLSSDPTPTCESCLQGKMTRSITPPY